MPRNRLHRLVLDIRNNPGIRFRELMRKSKISNGTLSYYINKLEKLKTVKIKRTPKECRFFPRSIPGMEQKIIVVLRKRSQRKVLFLLQGKASSPSDICKATRLGPSTVSSKLKALTELNLVVSRYQGKLKIFKLKNPGKILEITKKYQDKIKITEP